MTEDHEEQEDQSALEPTCSLCKQVMFYWHDSWLCVICDNPTDGFAVWFDEATGTSSDVDDGDG